MKKFEDDVWSTRTRKRALWRKRRWHAALVFAVLVVLGLMVWLAVIGSQWLAVLFAALFIGAAVLLLLYAWRAVVTGELRGRFGNVKFKHVSPISFWLQISNIVVFGAFWFLIGLRLLGLAPHWLMR